VQIATADGWTTLGTPDKTVNLLTLTGGLEELLVSGASLPAGHYSQMRLLLGAGNTVKLADGSVHDLTVPSGLQTGIKLTTSVEVQEGTTADVFIDFDATHSIQIVGAGASGKYMLRPTIRAFDKVVTGSVSGTFTDADTSAPLAGAMVYAESLDGSGHPSIVRSAITSASGQYTLDLLPVCGTYYVVSQPLLGTTAYSAKASTPQGITAGAPVMSYSAAFTSDPSVGTISGGIAPLATADQSDAVNLMQSLVTGSTAATFIVRSGMATVGSSTETFSFASVPAGSYGLSAIRTTLAGDGSSSSATSAVQSATLISGGTAMVNFGF
jgi:hypothetical protein